MPSERPPLSDTELDVLKALWSCGKGTVRDVDARLRKLGRDWAYTTVQTLLNRLKQKGYVTVRKGRLAHEYRPLVDREGLLAQELKGLANQLCEGAATPLILALVNNHRFTSEELDELRRLIRETENPHYESERRGGKP